MSRPYCFRTASTQEPPPLRSSYHPYRGDNLTPMSRMRSAPVLSANATASYPSPSHSMSSHRYEPTDTGRTQAQQQLWSRSPSPRSRFKSLPLPYRHGDDEPVISTNTHGEPRRQPFESTNASRPSSESCRSSFSSRDASALTMSSEWTVLVKIQSSSATLSSSLADPMDLEDGFLLPLEPTWQLQSQQVGSHLGLGSETCLDLRLFLEVELAGRSHPWRALLTQVSWLSTFAKFFRHTRPNDQDLINNTHDSMSTSERLFERLPLPPLAQATGLAIGATIYCVLPRRTTAKPTMNPDGTLTSHPLQSTTVAGVCAERSHLRTLSLAKSYPLSNLNSTMDVENEVWQHVKPFQTPSFPEWPDLVSEIETSNDDEDEDDQDNLTSPPSDIDDSPYGDGGDSIKQSESDTRQDSCDDFQSSPRSARSSRTSLLSSLSPDFELVVTPAKMRRPPTHLTLSSSSSCTVQPKYRFPFEPNPLGIVIPLEEDEHHPRTSCSSRRRAVSVLPPQIMSRNNELGSDRIEGEIDLLTPTCPTFNRQRSRSCITPGQAWTQDWQEAVEQLRKRVGGPIPGTPAGLFYENWAEMTDVAIDGHLGPPAAAAVETTTEECNWTNTVSQDSNKSQVSNNNNDDDDDDNVELVDTNQDSSLISSDSDVKISSVTQLPPLPDVVVIQPTTKNEIVTRPSIKSSSSKDINDHDLESGGTWADLARRMQSPGALRLLCLAASDWPTEVLSQGKGLAPLLGQGFFEPLVHVTDDSPTITTAMQDSVESSNVVKKPRPLHLAGINTRPRAHSNIFDISTPTRQTFSEGDHVPISVPITVPVVQVGVVNDRYPDLVIY